MTRPPAAPDQPVTRLVCGGCGHVVPVDVARPYRCPRALTLPDTDHVLRPTLDPDSLTESRRRELLDAIADDDPHPFRRYRRLSHVYAMARARGLSDADYLDIIDTLDGEVTRVGGRGFRITPFDPIPDLASMLGLAEHDALVKNETGNVSGSHKGRHLFGLLVHLEVLNRSGTPTTAPLAIASCGNAALAAAVVARAARRDLDVYVPPDAHPVVLDQLQRLGARLVSCARRKGERGDPCYLRLREALADGAVPFTVQGNENGLTLDGGKTLGWEIVSRLLRSKFRDLDRIFVQVGGGALASATVLALRDAVEIGALSGMPKIHAVQTEAAHPLVAAYERVLDVDASGARPGETAVQWAAEHRSHIMRAWPDTPRSIATGILDDETYDWLAVVEGMLITGGYPVLVSETDLAEAMRLGSDAVGPVDATGASGLAGAMVLARDGDLARGETIAVLFTGAERSG